MKKVIFAAIALMGLSIAGLAQTSTAAKTQPVKMQVPKKVSAAQALQSKVATVHKTTPSSAPAQAKQVASKTIAKNAAAPVKKDGTPDRRYKANKRLAKNHHMKKMALQTKGLKKTNNRVNVCLQSQRPCEKISQGFFN